MAGLAASTDVVVANLPAALLQRFGLDYPSLCELRPDIIPASQSSFGNRGPDAGEGGFDGVGTGNRVQTSSPSDVFETRDGHVLTHVVGNSLFRRWARLIGEEDKWTSDPRFVTDQLRDDYRDVVCERMAMWCAARPPTKQSPNSIPRGCRPAR